MTGRDDVVGLPPAPGVVQIEVGMMQNFCEILSCPDSLEAAIVDPAWEVDRLLRAAAGLRVTQILITHTHHDHIEGVQELVAKTGATVWVHPLEAERVKAVSPDLKFLVDGGTVMIGRRGLRALHTPGHTVGGTCFLADGFLIAGDLLFVRGCGRTDFSGGSTQQMWDSLNRIGGLPEETRVFPGHNYGPTPTSTVGQELLENPYLRCANFEEFKDLRERKRKA